MDIILVPGFWLDGSAWDEVVPSLTAAGHTVHPVTLPGMGSVDADRSGVHLADHVGAVVEAIDAVRGGVPVTLVGHSASGGLVYAASDARPERVARIVYVDTGPVADGQAVNADFPADAVEYPLDWDEFEADSLRGMTDEIRADVMSRSVPQPGGTVREPHRLSDDDRRLDIPSTVVASEMSGEVLRSLVAQGHPFVAELARHRSYEIVDLPTGHWPMFTRPADLGEIIVAALRG
ncbi:alpha/beta fold hydrolase [Krasilnikoviella flava]|uniref:Pimeloyl-ACP methyl ester carboxylesterase n=1 Tax=Krasilnikoviella flava TaxID=526729 RepID=A0A1T5L9M4_9MICO|nr:alpha/beta hydrolase [Krasilnikoviella flava]SKC72681.1 Pimeloyl-ACP methyl ester carboxylesterase [Krasilnikoviella flava]